jgi:WD40 repeat protein
MDDVPSAPASVAPQSALPVAPGTLDPEARLGRPDAVPRYEVGGLLGRGGMGEVRIARDPRLGRDVAMKTSSAEHPDGARRLAREAALTARLEHPNIVPVYAAGRDIDGTPYYTMRVLHGHTLGKAIDAATDTTSRLRLVRHVLVAAEAIAYAYGRGVVHRDLKPANIMVGVFGETVVTDWGLACLIDVQDERGGGSPGFVSPEQARGEPVDGRADVYGLGATLYTILTGKPPPEAPSEAPPPLRSVAPDVPPELAAITDRALRADRDARYPGARALADDLLAWFEGRRVAAYGYTSRELAVRLWMSWRLPIAVSLAGALILATAVGVGWWRTEQERARAQASETAAIEARGAEEGALAQALLAQALIAAREDRAMDAEVLAVNALVRRELPTARGVLAQFGDRPRLTLRGRSTLPSCATRALSADGSHVLCVRADGVDVFAAHAPDQTLAHAAGEWGRGAFAGENERLVLVGRDGRIDIWEPPALPRTVGPVVGNPLFGESAAPGSLSFVTRSSSVVVDARAGRVWRWSACGVGVSNEGTALAADGTVYTTCVDRRVVRGAPGEVGAPFTALGDRDVPFSVAVGARGEVVVGTVRGSLLVFDADGNLVQRLDDGSEMARSVAIADDFLAAAFDDGSVRVWARESGLLVGGLRVPAAIVRWVRGGDTGGDSVLRIVSTTVEDRLVSVSRNPHRVSVGAGVSGLALSPDGAHVAVGLGSGAVREHALADGRLTGEWRWQDAVMKDVAYDHTGTRLATALMTPGPQRVIPRPDGVPTLLGVLPAAGLRRVTFLASGWAVAGSYLPAVWGWKPGMPDPITLAPIQLRELERDAAGRVALGLDTDDGMWRITDGDPPTLERIALVPQAQAVAVLPDGALLLVDKDVVRVDAHGVELQRYPIGTIGMDLAVAPDATTFAVAVITGEVQVWRIVDASPIARLIGHKARVGELTFSTDGRWLVTGGWDDTVRVWSMSALDTPAQQLRAAIERDWGTDLAAVLK